MQFTLTRSKLGFVASAVLVLFLFCSAYLTAQRLPYQIENRSEFPDREVFVAIVGEELPGGRFIWVDPVNGQINRMSRSDNTVPGPIIDGNAGPGLDGRYANAFRRLSDIPNKTLQIPQIAGCRIFISYESQLFLYFFGYDGAPRGYAGANLENETDPNQGITFEVIELTYNQFGIFNNTSRVDAFQYPIGLEVEGPGFFKRVGELKTREEIFSEWERTAPPAFRGLLDRDKGRIIFPTKSPTFPRDYLDGYIDDIWNKYRSDELFFSSDAGNWRGRVQGNEFVLRRESDGQIGRIPGKPSTLEAMEGSGVMASGGRWDLVVQAQFVAAITRHAIDLTAPSGQFQNWGDASRYYQVEPYNWYSKFLHREDISFEGQTYTFAYDDVYDQSSTIAFSNPTRAKITLGTISGGPPSPTSRATVYQDCNFGGYSVGLDEGDYNVNDLLNRGARNNDLSSLRVQEGFEVVLYDGNNFSGRSLVVRGDDPCLVNEGWNDIASSLRIRRQDGGGGGGGTTTLRIEAEDFTFQEGIQTEGSSEGGLNVGFTDPGDFMVYANVVFPASGEYTIEYRVASAIGGGRISTDLNAGNVQLGAVDVPNTGGWQNWTTVRRTVTVNAGTYPLGLFSITGGWNLNYINIIGAPGLAYVRSAGLTAPGNALQSPALALPGDVAIYPNPFDGAVTISVGEVAADVRVIDTQGKVVLMQRDLRHRQSLEWSHLAKGVYSVQIIRAGAVERTLRVVKQ